MCPVPSCRRPSRSARRPELAAVDRPAAGPGFTNRARDRTIDGPMQTHYADRLDEAIRRKRTPALVGIDPRPDQFPAEILERAEQHWDLLMGAN